MLSIIVNDCDDCGGINELADKLEKAIAKLS